MQTQNKDGKANLKIIYMNLKETNSRKNVNITIYNCFSVYCLILLKYFLLNSMLK